MNEKKLKKNFINFKKIKFYSKGSDELDIYSEIFNFNAYKLNSTENLVVIDIGMNVGIASLYFATFSNVKKIYGFEPFKYTYDCALENIELNPNLMKKIIPYNYGLGNEEKDTKGFINIELKGNSSTTRSASEGDKLEMVKIKPAGTVIKEIIDENPTSKIVIKMDCEGGETEIFRDRGFLMLLDRIDEIVIETHTVEFYYIINNVLKATGFNVESNMISHCNGYIKGTRF